MKTVSKLQGGERPLGQKQREVVKPGSRGLPNEPGFKSGDVYIEITFIGKNRDNQPGMWSENDST